MNRFVVKKVIDDHFEFNIYSTGFNDLINESDLAKMNSELVRRLEQRFYEDPESMLTIEISEAVEKESDIIIERYCKKHNISKTALDVACEWNYDYNSETDIEYYISNGITRFISDGNGEKSIKHFREFKEKINERSTGKNKPPAVVFRLDGESPESEG